MDNPGISMDVLVSGLGWRRRGHSSDSSQFLVASTEFSVVHA